MYGKVLASGFSVLGFSVGFSVFNQVLASGFSVSGKVLASVL